MAARAPAAAGCLPTVTATGRTSRPTRRVRHAGWSVHHRRRWRWRQLAQLYGAGGEQGSMVKVAPAHSSPHGHPPEEACSPARGCPLEDPSPRGCRAEAAPVPAGSRRFPPPLPVQEGPGVERSTFLEYRTCRRSPPPSPTPPSRSARTPHSALVRVACRPSAVRQHGQSAPPPLGSARARLPFHPRARLAAVAGAALQEAAGTRGAQPLPRVLEPATSKAAHFPALGPLSVS